MRVIALMNQKGGVGKTTTAVNLGACLAELGKRVLLIDMDPQANLSVHVDVDADGAEKSVYHVLTGRLPFADTILPTTLPGVDVIPSHIDLSGAEIELVQAMGRETILRDALQEFTKEREDPYNIVLIDCPPSLGLLSLNAMAAASEVMIPLQMEFFALRGMSKLLEVIRLVQKRLNPSIEITGIIPCMFDTRKRLSRDVLEEVKNYFQDKVLETRIRCNVRIAEAPSHGKAITEYDLECNGTEDYRRLAREVLRRAGEEVPEPPGPAPEEEATPEASEPPVEEEAAPEVSEAAGMETAVEPEGSAEESPPPLPDPHPPDVARPPPVGHDAEGATQWAK